MDKLRRALSITYHRRSSMLTREYSHVVRYETPPSNPNAARQIVTAANCLFGLLYMTLHGLRFHAAIIVPTFRVVGKSKFSVMLTFIFPDKETFERYMNHPYHLEFVQFVLRGWRLKGDSGPGAGDRFINHILHARPEDPPREWERDPLIPDPEVVWAGEDVTDGYNPE